MNKLMTPKQSKPKDLAREQLRDCLKAMPQGTRLGIKKSQRKNSDDLPLFKKDNQTQLF